MQRKSPAAWRLLLEEWAGSNLTQKEFCALHSIAVSGLHYWSKKFKEETLSLAPSPAFVPVKITSVAKAHYASQIELVMPDGRRVHFHQGADAGFLKALLS
jgi:hypothetical protein